MQVFMELAADQELVDAQIQGLQSVPYHAASSNDKVDLLTPSPTICTLSATGLVFMPIA